MRVPCCLLAGLVMLCQGKTTRAEAPPSPLRLIPAEADLVIEARSLRRIHDLIVNQAFVKEIQKFPATQEFLNSTQVRRFHQLLAYYEKELGAKYPDLLERLSGGGVALGVKLGPNPAPTLIVIRGTDEKLTRDYFKLAIRALEQELQRAEAKVQVSTTNYQGTVITKIGPDLQAAAVGSVILIANKDAALHKGLDLLQGRAGKSLADSESVAAARKLLPADPLAWLWLNMETVRMGPGAKDVYKTPRDPAVSVLFGSYVDVVGRTPFVAAALQSTADGFLATVRMPRGRDGAGIEKAMHLPPDDKRDAGSRPLLEPKGALYSYSFYLDLGRIWEDRVKLFGPNEAKAIEKADKDSGKLPISGIQLSKLLTGSGVYHRFVAVNQPKASYTVQPKTSIPAFAYVQELRDPAFAKTLETGLRGGAFLATTQFKLKSTEEKYKDCTIVGYRFPEDQKVKNDVNDIRFNFSPCFTRVGNQFVVCSTIELCRDLIDVLQAEARSARPSSAATSRQRLYSAGVADVLLLFEDQLITQAILDQAVPATDAKEQVRAFINLLRHQGSAGTEITFLPNEFRFEIRVQGARQLRGNTTNK